MSTIANIDSSDELGAIQLLRGLAADRERPDLEALGAETDPDRFVRTMLPHAARSFAASIVILPRRAARAASVAYLYCRMLDTYEDLLPGPEAKVTELTAFGSRFASSPLPEPPPLPAEAAQSDRDRVHLLLVERCGLVDQVYVTLNDEERALIADLVRDMSEGMVWSTKAFAAQGGVLADAAQLSRYCRAVIGLPAVFLLELVRTGEFTPEVREDALQVSELIQIANVTRDIEADLERGIGYHPALAPYLGARPESAEALETVRRVRRELTALALSRTPAYRRMYEGLGLADRASVRTAALVLLLFTSLHYRGMAEATGGPTWSSPRSRAGVVRAATPSLISRGAADRVLRKAERSMLAACSPMYHSEHTRT